MVISDSDSRFPVQPAERRRCFQRESHVSTPALSRAMAGAHLPPQAVREADLGRGILDLGASMGHLSPILHVRGWGGNASAFGVGWSCCLNVVFLPFLKLAILFPEQDYCIPMEVLRHIREWRGVPWRDVLGLSFQQLQSTWTPLQSMVFVHLPQLRYISHFCIVMFLFSH